MVRVSILLAGLFLAAAAQAAPREAKQIREQESAFVGAVGCKSSSCHGGAGEKRSQYITWSRQDFHTRAFPILLDARSARIAEAVGIGEAQSSARCTVCHSPFQSVAQAQMAAGVRPDEGVSCETCHGAAGSWLRGHTRPDWTYAMRVSAGMHDLRNLYVRANACVACHQNIDTDLLKAGHPALVFELDSQSVNEPKHWRDDAPWSGARAWVVGQAVALREAAWRCRTEADPAPDIQATSVALAWLLAKVTLLEPMLPKVIEPSSSDLQVLQSQADNLARRAADWTPNADWAISVVRTLAEADPELTVGKDRSKQDVLYRARRLVLAVDRLTQALSQNSGPILPIDKELSQLRQDVAPNGNFEPVTFVDHLHALHAKL